MAEDLTDAAIPSDASGGFDLCLSGGGFRAALFHLGVVFYLSATNRLSRVTNIYAVSGGAVLAAHLKEHWADYLVDDAAPHKVGNVARTFVKPITRYSFRNFVIYLAAAIWAIPLGMVLGGIALGYSPPGIALIVAGVLLVGLFIRRPPLRWSARIMYRWFFRFKTAWHRLPAAGPKLHILATDLSTGRQAEFSELGLRLIPDAVSPDAGLRERGRSLVTAVAASAGFPPAFPPQVISLHNERYVLTDGGVFDNLGIRARRDLAPLCLVSNASGQFIRKGSEREYNWTVIRNVRASDILMTRLGEEELKLAPQYEHISIALNFDSPELDSSIRRDLPLVRTDLNRFSSGECVALILHGAEVADKTLQGRWGLMTKAERDLIHSTIRIAMNKRAGAALAIRAKDVRGTNRVRLWALSPIVALYTLAFFWACYSIGGIPEERVFGFVRNLFGGPTMTVAQDGSEFTKVLDEDPTLQLYWAELIGDKSGRYYHSSEFAGPLKDTSLTLEYSDNVPITAEDTFAVLMPQNGSLPRPTWLKTRVTTNAQDQTAINILIPAFAGRATICLFVATTAELETASKWKTMEPLP